MAVATDKDLETAGAGALVTGFRRLAQNHLGLAGFVIVAIIALIFMARDGSRSQASIPRRATVLTTRSGSVRSTKAATAGKSAASTSREPTPTTSWSSAKASADRNRRPGSLRIAWRMMASRSPRSSRPGMPTTDAGTTAGGPTDDGAGASPWSRASTIWRGEGDWP